MSLEDDTDNTEIELRDLVNQTLEDNGILAKIRAQLRAGLYLALENDINTGYQDTYNKTLKTKLESTDIRIIFCLVREFLEYFELNFTTSVFDKETLLGTSYNYENREKLIQELDIGIDALHNAPLLLEILNIARSSFNISVRDIKFNSTTTDNKNDTYDIPQEKSNQSEKDNSFSESATSEVSQHVIGVKAVPKENTQEELDLNFQNGNEDESIQEEVPTQQSEVIISKKSAAKEDKFEDDTYEGTSSIAEDSVAGSKEQNLIDLERSIKFSPKSIIDQTLDESKSPRLSFSPDQDKRKQDKEKLKPMSGLTSLSDLPPLQLNKSIKNSDTVLLPSLYSKKSPLKDIDKLLDVTFDSLDNYEEDFMSSGSVENEEADMNNILQNIKLKKESRRDTKSPIPSKVEENIVSNENENEGSKQESAATSISEEFDINSNVDDLLKSSSTT